MRLSGGLVGVVRHDDETVALLDVLGAGEAPVAGLCADLSAVAGDAGEEVVPLLRPDVDADDDERSPDQLRTGDRGGVRVVHAGLLRVGFLPSGEPTAPRYVIDLPRPIPGHHIPKSLRSCRTWASWPGPCRILSYRKWERSASMLCGVKSVRTPSGHAHSSSTPPGSLSECGPQCAQA